MSLSDDAWITLQEAFATQPVLVLGSGCHRIGYDKAPSWDAVTRRVGLVWQKVEGLLGRPHAELPQRFLGQLWISKLSDERREELAEDIAAGSLPGRYDISSVGPAGSTDVDEVAAVIGAHLLCALHEATRCLGSEIARGTAPVVRWQWVEHRGESEEAYASAGRHLSEVAALCELFADGMTRQLKQRDRERLRAAGYRGAVTARPGLERGLQQLKIRTIATATRRLHDRCFRSGDEPLSGASIEWLADLFWHLMVVDSRVPPSQAETAFYLNLRDEVVGTMANFSRPRPGELPDHRLHRALVKDARELLRTYDSGLGEKPDRETPRAAFATTIAASLLASSRQRPAGRPRQPTIALSPDLDLHFERATLELMTDPEEAIHLVVPAGQVRGKTLAGIQWLFATVPRGRGGQVDLEALRAPRWEPYGPQEGPYDNGGVLRGPIFIKLIGAPLLTLPTDVESFGLGSGETLEPLAIATDLQAIRAITRLPGRSAGDLAGQVEQSLRWKQRSWVFLGDSFPDWLPRLRLLFNSTQSAHGETGLQVAIDRRFDWPEIGLLEALDIDHIAVDLERVTEYYDRPNLQRSDSPMVDQFLEQVRSMCRRRA